MGMTQSRDTQQTKDAEAPQLDAARGDALDSPASFMLWIAGLFGIGVAAFVLSALMAR
jgi:hypothetical protein